MGWRKPKKNREDVARNLRTQIDILRRTIANAGNVRLLQTKDVKRGLDTVLLTVGNDAVNQSKNNEGSKRDEAIGMMIALDKIQETITNIINEGDKALSEEKRLNDKLDRLNSES